MKEIATALTEGFKLLRSWLEGSERRNFKTAIDQGESYIHIAEPLITEHVPKDENKKDLKLLRKHKKVFFKKNQG